MYKELAVVEKILIRINMENIKQASRHSLPYFCPALPHLAGYIE
jgi:hypothetical protein